MSSIQNNLTDAKSTSDIANAQSDLSIEAAKRSLNDAINNKDNELEGVKSALQTSEQAYIDAQSQHSTVSNTLATKQSDLSNLNANIAQAQTEMATTVDETRLNELTQNISNLETERENLIAEIAELQSSLAMLQGSLNELKSAYDMAVSNYNSAVNAYDSNIAALQDNVKNAELTAKSATITQNAQVSTYEEQLEKGIVTALVSGTVSSVNVKVGDLYSGTTIATINGVEQLIIEAQIDEYDIPDITTGMKVLIKTDATREEELEGQITYVATTATTSATSALTETATTTSGTATYLVKISLNEQNERLRLGMNAKLSIITNQVSDVWTVPYDCIYERDDGTHYIEIAKDDIGNEKEEIDVQVGLEGAYYVEIQSSKLQAGMKVILPQVETSSSLEDLIVNMGADGGM